MAEIQQLRQQRTRAEQAMNDALAEAEIRRGRRPLVKGEHLFVGRKHQGRRHVYTRLGGDWGHVIACSLCGVVQKGETMPAVREPLTR